MNETYGDRYDIEYHILYPFKFYFLIPNLVFLHVESKMTRSIPKKTILINFLPGIAEFITLCIIAILVRFNILDAEGNFIYYFDEFYSYLTVIYCILIQLIILKKIAVYNGLLFGYFSTIRYKYLNWLKWVCIIFITNEIYYILYYIFSPDLNNDNYYLPVVLLELFLIFYVGINALLQTNLEMVVPQEELGEREMDVSEDESKLFSEIEYFMSTSKPFLNADLNLKSLSQLMGVPERHISNAINKNTDSNFHSFINLYRVQEAIQMLKNEDYSKYSIVGIGEAAGFNSKSSFYNNFKKVTNVSPSQYIESIS